MTIIKQIDAAIQSAVDAAAFAIMRRFGCGKGPLRFGLYLSVVVLYLAKAAIKHQPLVVISAFVWLLIAEWHRRLDLSADGSGLKSVSDIGFQWVKLMWLGFIAIDMLYLSAFGISADAILLTAEYFRATPPTPPPSHATSRQLATEGAA